MSEVPRCSNTDRGQFKGSCITSSLEGVCRWNTIANYLVLMIFGIRLGIKINIRAVVKNIYIPFSVEKPPLLSFIIDTIWSCYQRCYSTVDGLQLVVSEDESEEFGSGAQAQRWCSLEIVKAQVEVL